jgi:hypothetical protein
VLAAAVPTHLQAKFAPLWSGVFKPLENEMQTQTQTEKTPVPPAVSRRLTPGQSDVIDKLKARFDIDEDRILFLDPEHPDTPWIPPGELTSIARQSEAFTNIAEGFDSFIPELKQIVHSATIVDNAGKVYTRTGVATIGERLSKFISNMVGDVDEHSLAAARAISAALRSAGFDPFRSGSVVSLGTIKRSTSDEATDRVNDLRTIHAIAQQKGMITSDETGLKNDRRYRNWLFQHFEVMSASRLDEPTRKRVINLLKQEPDSEESIA